MLKNLKKNIQLFIQILNLTFILWEFVLKVILLNKNLQTKKGEFIYKNNSSINQLKFEIKKTRRTL